MTFQRHGLEAFGHIGFIDALKVHGFGGFLEDQLRHTAQISACGIAQIGQRLPLLTGQREDGIAIRIGLGISSQHLMPQAHHFIACRVQLERLGGVIVGDQQIATTFHQSHHRIVHIECEQATAEWAKLLVHCRDPVREESERQCVRHGKAHHALARTDVGAQHGAGALQGLQYFQRLLIHGLACGRQTRRVRASVDQIRSSPGLQRLNAARESGLRHVAQLGRAAETASFSKADKIFKPFGFHRPPLSAAPHQGRATEVILMG